MSRFVTALSLLAVVFVFYQTEAGAQQESTPLCPVNETWTTCGNLCWEPKCQGTHTFCPEYCISPGICTCTPNYYRNENTNQCVLYQDCP